MNLIELRNKLYFTRRDSKVMTILKTIGETIYPTEVKKPVIKPGSRIELLNLKNEKVEEAIFVKFSYYSDDKDFPITPIIIFQKDDGTLGYTYIENIRVVS